MDSALGRGSGPLALRNDRGFMRARLVIESERWSEMKAQSSFDNIDELFALGMSAGKLDDACRDGRAGPRKLLSDATAAARDDANRPRDAATS